MTLASASVLQNLKTYKRQVNSNLRTISEWINANKLRNNAQKLYHQNAMAKRLTKA